MKELKDFKPGLKTCSKCLVKLVDERLRKAALDLCSKQGCTRRVKKPSRFQKYVMCEKCHQYYRDRYLAVEAKKRKSRRQAKRVAKSADPLNDYDTVL